MILHRLSSLCSGARGCWLPAPCTKRGTDDNIVSYLCHLTMSQDACALNADGSLKDAADITFFNDPDDDVPLPNVPPSTQPSTSTASTRDAYSVLLKAGRTPATVAAGSRRSGRPLKPSARMRDADNACGLSSGTRKRALSSATDHPAPKKVAMRFLSPLDSEDEDEDVDPRESSADELVPQPDVEDLDDTDDAKSENGVVTQTVCIFHVDCLPSFTNTCIFSFQKMNVQQMLGLYSLAVLMGGCVPCASKSSISFSIFFKTFTQGMLVNQRTSTPFAEALQHCAHTLFATRRPIFKCTSSAVMLQALLCTLVLFRQEKSTLLRRKQLSTPTSLRNPPCLPRKDYSNILWNWL